LCGDDGDFYNNRGSAYTEKGNLRHALADYERAAVLKPGDATIQENLEKTKERLKS